MTPEVRTLSARPGLRDRASHLEGAAWPEFMLHDPVADRFWEPLKDAFPELQFAVCEGEEIVATGNSVPAYWDGTPEGLPGGWDAVLEAGLAQPRRGVEPAALCALSAVVAPGARGRGLGGVVLRAMSSAAAARGLGSLIAPVRPSLKSLYPNEPVESYAGWRREDGEVFDPWLRTHRRIGGEMLGVASRSMVIRGSVSEWERWTGMSFPESGVYPVPGALVPVSIDREGDLGLYEEPNVWFRHPLPGG